MGDSARFRTLGRHLLAAYEPEANLLHLQVRVEDVSTEDKPQVYTGGGAGIVVADVEGYRNSTKFSIGGVAHRLVFQLVREPVTPEEKAECERLAAEYAKKSGNKKSNGKPEALAF